MNEPLRVPRSILGSNDREGTHSDDPPVPSRRFIPDVVEYWRRVMARKWTLVAIVLAFAASALLLMLGMVPVYTATATVMIEPSRNRVVSIEEVYAGSSGTREFFGTQAEFIGSRNVAERVIEKLQLSQHPEFDPRQQEPSKFGQLKAALLSQLRGSDEPQAAPTAENITNSVLRNLQSRLEIEPVRMSQLVKVHVDAKDRMLAAQIANAMVEGYIEADMDARYLVTQQAHSWLGARVATLRDKLAASEAALQAYRDSKGLIDKQSAAQGGAARQLEELTQRLVEARVVRSQAEEAYNQVSSPIVRVRESSPAVLANAFVSRAREARIDAQRRMSEFAQRFGESHPQYQSARTELMAAEESVRQAVATVSTGIIKEFESARAVERSLEQAVAAARATIQAQNRDEPALAIYERDVETNRQLYERFLSRAKETDVASDIQSPIGRLLDPARPPDIASKPALTRWMLIALLAGLVVGVAIVLLLDRLDTTFSSVADLEAVLPVPVMAALPKLGRFQSKHAHKMMTAEPDSGFSEAIRTARTSILLSTLDTPGRVIVITSSLADEGKTTVAINLALAQSQTKKTLLIEADLRRPSYTKLLGFEMGQKGLNDLLAGNAAMEECITRPTQGALDVLTSGTSFSNPLELLSSRRLPEVIQAAKQVYDMIIIDTPPLALVSDASVISTVANGVILVVRASHTPRRLALQSVRKLAQSPAPVLGVIVNRVDFRRAKLYYGEYNTYSAEAYGGYGPSRA